MAHQRISIWLNYQTILGESVLLFSNQFKEQSPSGRKRFILAKRTAPPKDNQFIDPHSAQYRELYGNARHVAYPGTPRKKSDQQNTATNAETAVNPLEKLSCMHPVSELTKAENKSAESASVSPQSEPVAPDIQLNISQSESAAALTESFVAPSQQGLEIVKKPEESFNTQYQCGTKPEEVLDLNLNNPVLANEKLQEPKNVVQNGNETSESKHEPFKESTALEQEGIDLSKENSAIESERQPSIADTPIDKEINLVAALPAKKKQKKTNLSTESAPLRRSARSKPAVRYTGMC